MPIPTFPFGVTVSKFVPLDDAMVNGFVAPDPCTASVDATVFVPMLKYLFELSQYKFELFCVSKPLAPMNGTEP